MELIDAAVDDVSGVLLRSQFNVDNDGEITISVHCLDLNVCILFCLSALISFVAVYSLPVSVGL